MPGQESSEYTDFSGELREADIKGTIARTAALHYLGLGSEEYDKGLKMNPGLAAEHFYRASAFARRVNGPERNGLLTMSGHMLKTLEMSIEELDHEEKEELEELLFDERDVRNAPGVEKTRTGTYVQTFISMAYSCFMRTHPQEPSWSFEPGEHRSRIYSIVEFVHDSLEVIGLEGMEEEIIDREDWDADAAA